MLAAKNNPWDLNSIFMKILRDKILLYWPPTWPLFHVVANQELLVSYFTLYTQVQAHNSLPGRMSEEITVHHQPNIETSEGNKRTCASLSYIYILSSIAPPGGGGGTQTKFYTGKLYPKVHPLTLL